MSSSAGFSFTVFCEQLANDLLHREEEGRKHNLIFFEHASSNKEPLFRESSNRLMVQVTTRWGLRFKDDCKENRIERLQVAGNRARKSSWTQLRVSHFREDVERDLFDGVGSKKTSCQDIDPSGILRGTMNAVLIALEEHIEVYD